MGQITERTCNGDLYAWGRLREEAVGDFGEVILWGCFCCRDVSLFLSVCRELSPGFPVAVAVAAAASTGQPRKRITRCDSWRSFLRRPPFQPAGDESSSLRLA